MNIIVIGSLAGRYHRCIPKRNKLLDIDIISDFESAEKFAFEMGEILDVVHTDAGIIIHTDKMPIEAELIEKRDHTNRLFNAIRSDMTEDEIYAPKEWLYFLKASHKYRKDSPHFFKTLKDIHYMRNMGIKMPTGSEGLLKEREELTYTNSLPKLNVSKGDFFKEIESYNIFDHDSLHKALALEGTPAYTKYMKDGSEVLTCKDKFFSVDQRVRLLGGLEEALVLTAERSLIPNDFKPNPDEMFIYALQKVCTSITGGYFREFCYDHWFNIVNLYREECSGWVERLQHSLDNGEVMKYNPTSSIY